MLLSLPAVVAADCCAVQRDTLSHGMREGSPGHRRLDAFGPRRDRGSGSRARQQCESAAPLMRSSARVCGYAVPDCSRPAGSDEPIWVRLRVSDGRLCNANADANGMLCRSGCLDTVKRLASDPRVDVGSVNVRQCDGLYLAAQSGSTSVVQWLTTDPSVRDRVCVADDFALCAMDC